MTWLLVVRERNERVRGNIGIDGGMGAGGGIISGFTGVGTGRLKNGEKLRGRLSIGSIRKGDAVVTDGSNL